MSQPYSRPALAGPARRLSHAESSPWDSAVAAYYVELCEYVLRYLGSAEAAEDLVQDLFLHLWDTRSPRDAVRLTRPYLYVAARNRALKYLRHRRVVSAWIDRLDAEEPPVADSPEDICLRHELDDAVQRALTDLPPRCRSIFLLRRRDQLSYQEIAARVGVSLGTVKSQMWRAAARLKNALSPYLTEGRCIPRSRSRVL